jgi:hypothetical protein
MSDNEYEYLGFDDLMTAEVIDSPVRARGAPAVNVQEIFVEVEVVKPAKKKAKVEPVPPPLTGIALERQRSINSARNRAARGVLTGRTDRNAVDWQHVSERARRELGSHNGDGLAPRLRSLLRCSNFQCDERGCICAVPNAPVSPALFAIYNQAREASAPEVPDIAAIGVTQAEYDDSVAAEQRAVRPRYRAPRHPRGRCVSMQCLKCNPQFADVAPAPAAPIVEDLTHGEENKAATACKSCYSEFGSVDEVGVKTNRGGLCECGQLCAECTAASTREGPMKCQYECKQEITLATKAVKKVRERKQERVLVESLSANGTLVSCGNCKETVVFDSTQESGECVCRKNIHKCGDSDHTGPCGTAGDFAFHFANSKKCPLCGVLITKPPLEDHACNMTGHTCADGTQVNVCQTSQDCEFYTTGDTLHHVNAEHLCKCPRRSFQLPVYVDTKKCSRCNRCVMYPHPDIWTLWELQGEIEYWERRKSTDPEDIENLTFLKMNMRGLVYELVDDDIVVEREAPLTLAAPVAALAPVAVVAALWEPLPERGHVLAPLINALRDARAGLEDRRIQEEVPAYAAPLNDSPEYAPADPNIGSTSPMYDYQGPEENDSPVYTPLPPDGQNDDPFSIAWAVHQAEVTELVTTPGDEDEDDNSGI